jgi:hypothetical protein
MNLTRDRGKAAVYENSGSDLFTPPAFCDVGVAVLRKILLPLAIVLSLVLAFQPYANPLLEKGVQYNRNVAAAMAVSYTSLRVLKGVLAVPADADLSGGIGVIGLEASPGQVITPVIDTVERMANLLFALAIFSGVLFVMLPIATSLSAIVLGIGLVVPAAMQFLPPVQRHYLRPLRRVSVVMIAIGLMGVVALPGTYALASVLGGSYVDAAASRSQNLPSDANLGRDLSGFTGELEAATELPEISERTDGLEPSVPAEQGTMWGDLTSALGSARDAVGGAISGLGGQAVTIGTQAIGQVTSSLTAIDTFLERSEELFALLIGLAVAYIAKLIILPIMILAVALVVARACIGLFDRDSRFVAIGDSHLSQRSNM